MSRILLDELLQVLGADTVAEITKPFAAARTREIGGTALECVTTDNVAA